MAKNELKNRSNWQAESGPAGKSGAAEKNLIKAFETEFENSDYTINAHPNDFKHIYDDVILPDRVLKQIYCPNNSIMENAKKRGWGIAPDFSIKNVKTNKILFGEIKRQDGWVEDTLPSAGRGNAHERLCKLFTPGLEKIYRKIGKIDNEEILPFWVVFEGDITRDPKRNREIALWFDKFDKNYFMWCPNMTDQDLINHFNKYLKRYLD